MGGYDPGAPEVSNMTEEVSPAGPDAAMRALYDRHGANLLSYLMRMTRGDRHRAEDILQETLIRAWQHPEARGDDGEWSRPWLFTVARRIAVDHARAALVRPTELPDRWLEDRPQADDDIERMVDAAEVRAALASLPPRMREAIIEVYFRGHTVTEAATALGIPPGTVKSRTFYGLTALREELRARGFHRPNEPD
jgi:RNA polymerase sigma-70 factor (ECF subfamily)